MPRNDSNLNSKREQLLDCLRSLGSCAVAFSGGVDSAVVAKAARVALGDQAVAVTGTSASLAEGELAEAKRIAELIGIRHVIVETDEFSRVSYTRNAPDRCYHCKTELYSQIGNMLSNLRVSNIVNGTNANDVGDYRPGMLAAGEKHVHSPLAECGIGKDDVRAIAAAWQLPVWDKPASPCLASRVAYGEDVTPQRLEMIDQAEQHLRDCGFREVRVRYHRGDVARIELPIDGLQKLGDSQFRNTLIERFKALGFKFITLDLEGFRSGSLNQLIQIDDLRKTI